MIQSMTGYGQAIKEYQEKKIHVEIKSLNSKALDLSVRIAPLYREKEMEIRQMISTALIRGKVDVAIWMEKDAAADATPINGALVENYYHQLKTICEQTGVPEPTDWYATIMRLPDVTTRTEVETLSDSVRQMEQDINDYFTNPCHTIFHYIHMISTNCRHRHIKTFFLIFCILQSIQTPRCFDNMHTCI